MGSPNFLPTAPNPSPAIATGFYGDPANRGKTTEQITAGLPNFASWEAAIARVPGSDVEKTNYLRSVYGLGDAWKVQNGKIVSDDHSTRNGLLAGAAVIGGPFALEAALGGGGGATAAGVGAGGGSGAAYGSGGAAAGVNGVEASINAAENAAGYGGATAGALASLPAWAKALVQAGIPLAALTSTLGAGGGGDASGGGLGPGTDGLMGEVQSGLALQRKRLESTGPVWDSLVNSAYGNQPTRYRGAPPAGYPAAASEAPSGAYAYQEPQFRKNG